MIDWIYFLMLNCSILFILYSIEVPANLLKLTCHEGRVIRDKYLPIPKEIKNFRGFIPILYPISDGIWLYNLKVSFIRFLGYENSGYLTLFSSAGYCEMCFREDIRILIQKAREKEEFDEAMSLERLLKDTIFCLNHCVPIRLKECFQIKDYKNQKMLLGLAFFKYIGICTGLYLLLYLIGLFCYGMSIYDFLITEKYLWGYLFNLFLPVLFLTYVQVEIIKALIGIWNRICGALGMACRCGEILKDDIKGDILKEKVSSARFIFEFREKELIVLQEFIAKCSDAIQKRWEEYLPLLNVEPIQNRDVKNQIKAFSFLKSILISAIFEDGFNGGNLLPDGSLIKRDRYELSDDYSLTPQGEILMGILERLYS